MYTRSLREIPYLLHMGQDRFCIFLVFGEGSLTTLLCTPAPKYATGQDRISSKTRVIKRKINVFSFINNYNHIIQTKYVFTLAVV